jgi:hypothetical protein
LPEKHDQAHIVRNFGRVEPFLAANELEKLLTGIYICDVIMAFVMVRRQKEGVCSDGRPRWRRSLHFAPNAEEVLWLEAA